MNEKPAAKSKRLVKADLNFISQKPLEIVVQEIQALAPKAITAQVAWTEADTALFQLTYSRDGRTTAAVTGRLQRWAGDMTHIYCDGRTFHKKISYVSGFVRWLVAVALVAPLITCPAAILSGSTVAFLMFGYSLLAFAVVGTIVGLLAFAVHVLQITKLQRRESRQGSLSKPEKKDRERLLQFLTEIIRDEDYILAQDAPDAVPLSDEEAAAFLEQAALMARLNKL
jgi:membrane protein implicated in regulation of membrane protease activity